jgi:hypothetical protein
MIGCRDHDQWGGMFIRDPNAWDQCTARPEQRHLYTGSVTSRMGFSDSYEGMENEE